MKLHEQKNIYFSFLKGPEEEHGIPPWVEPCVIFSILILNAVVGIYQDYDAERALEALKDLQSLGAVVLRASKWTEIQAKELVPGDIVKVKKKKKHFLFA